MLKTEYDDRGLAGNSHHREGGAWTASFGRFHRDVRRVIVTAVQRTDTTVADSLYARLLVDGVPVAGDVTDALASLPRRVRFARPWDTDASRRYIATLGDSSRHSGGPSPDATAGGERLLQALEAEETERVETDDGRREFWIENPFYEDAAAFREEFQFNEAVTDDTIEFVRDTAVPAVLMQRDLYEHIPELRHLRVHSTGGSAPDTHALETVSIQRLRPRPGGQLELTNVNVVVKGKYSD